VSTGYIISDQLSSLSSETREFVLVSGWKCELIF